ncbi:MAG: aldo/keto reductase [Phycisphaerae bacterium]
MAPLIENISPIGFGAFKIGRNQGIRYPRGYELPDEAAVDRLLNGVLDLGINYIDTAPAYGLSEQRIGKALAHRRDEFFLSTKVGENFQDGQSTFDFSEHAVRNSIHRSLQRLGTEALDLVFVHANRQDVELLNGTDVVPTLLALRDEGHVKAVGLSAYTAEAFEQSLDWADAIMVEYHLDDPSAESVISAAADKDVAVMVKKGLASGRLKADRAVAFVLSNPLVNSMVVGGLNLDHFRDNLAVAARVRRAGSTG